MVVTIRPFQESFTPAILNIFAANIREEWGVKYHQGKYLKNAENYIATVVNNEDSDLHNISNVYIEPGGAFWVLVDQTSPNEETVVGMVGLQVFPSGTNGNPLAEGEIRRNCILPNYRGQGFGTKMCNLVKEAAKAKSLYRLFCSTPEHGDDVIRFYSNLGFSEFGERKELHGTPIKEVFLECIMT